MKDGSERDRTVNRILYNQDKAIRHRVVVHSNRKSCWFAFGLANTWQLQKAADRRLRRGDVWPRRSFGRSQEATKLQAIFISWLNGMYNNHGDRAQIVTALTASNVHADEIERVAHLGSVPESDGQAIVNSLPARPPLWYAPDVVNPRYLTTNIHHAPAIDLEAAVVGAIGAGTSRSQYERLFVGCTTADAPPDPDVVHVNCVTEDMRFPSDGPRVLTDGKTVPVRSDFFRRSEGMHIPYDVQLTQPLIGDIFRTLRSGGVLLYAPSTHVNLVMSIMRNTGFTGVAIIRLARQTVYNGRLTLPTQVISATKP